LVDKKKITKSAKGFDITYLFYYLVLWHHRVIDLCTIRKAEIALGVDCVSTVKTRYGHHEIIPDRKTEEIGEKKELCV
jgi:hypothetical protein